MKRIISVLLLLLSIQTNPASAQSTEIAGTNIIVSPWTYWADPRAGRFYNPAGIKIGNRYWLYVQGGRYLPVLTGPGSECLPLGEQILAFSNPWTHTGLRSHFTYEGLVSPCNTSAPEVHYQLGSVFQSSWDLQYKMLIDETESGATYPEDFKRVLLRTSTDGRSWTTLASQNPFLKQSVVGGTLVAPIEVALVQGSSDWWGMFLWGGAANKVGRIKVTQTPANPRGFVVYIFASDSIWRAVGDDGAISFLPANVATANQGSIVFDDGLYEYWHSGGTLQATTGCIDEVPGNSSLTLRTITEAGALGPLQTVTSSVRPMPTLNRYGRMYPFRHNDPNGKKLVYSASLDRMCEFDPAAWAWRGLEIVNTVVDN